MPKCRTSCACHTKRSLHPPKVRNRLILLRVRKENIHLLQETMNRQVPWDTGTIKRLIFLQKTTACVRWSRKATVEPLETFQPASFTMSSTFHDHIWKCSTAKRREHKYIIIITLNKFRHAGNCGSRSKPVTKICAFKTAQACLKHTFKHSGIKPFERQTHNTTC